MKIRKIMAMVILIAVFALSACSSGKTGQSEEDAALQQKLVGMWFYPESAEYDEDGNLIAFSAYQFTDQALRCHDVTETQVMTYLMDAYKIENGRYVVTASDGTEQYAVISIKEVDGKDHLFWDIETKTMEFIRMTDEEIEEYSIPNDPELADEEKALLGIGGVETGSEEIMTIPSALE